MTPLRIVIWWPPAGVRGPRRRTARFLGLERAHKLVGRGLDELEAAGGTGSGKASGDAAAARLEAAVDAAATNAKAELEAAVVRRNDPYAEPPPLLEEPPAAQAVASQ